MSLMAQPNPRPATPASDLRRSHPGTRHQQVARAAVERPGNGDFPSVFSCRSARPGVGADPGRGQLRLGFLAVTAGYVLPVAADAREARWWQRETGLLMSTVLRRG